MKYYIIANNTDITQQSIDKLELDGENLLVLFNYLWPLRFQEVLDYDNKICISRKTAERKHGKEAYANIKQLKQDQELFKKIYFHTHPSYMSEISKRFYQREIDKYRFDDDKLGILDSNKTSIRNKIGYPSGKNISTGMIAYEYFMDIKNYRDEIILVGFNSKISTKFHNSQWEKLYMLRQIYMNRCKFIQCYGLMERIS